MSRPAKGRLDLLGESRRQTGEGPPEAPSGDRPDEESWRADALARSRHSRLDEVPRPGESFDQAAAESLCADLARKALGDFAPALLLLPAGERRRVQALAAYAFTLFDFARQRGVEGERLAQVNRWEFTLEAALAGEAVGQPVFLALAREHRRRPWPQPALDALAAAARERGSDPLPATAEALDRRRRRLAGALAAGLLETPAPALADLGAALLAVPGLVGVGEELRQKRSPLAAEELAPAWVAGRPPTAMEVLAAARRGSGALRARLEVPPPELATLPAPWRRSLAFLRLAALALLDRLEACGEEELFASPPRLGLRDRLVLLLRARWRG